MQVMRNLHVVFTMNPTGDGLRQRAATSPALFNRCVLSWFGDWTNDALYQVSAWGHSEDEGGDAGGIGIDAFLGCGTSEV